MSDGKRRLPLVKGPDAAREEDVARPAWQWTMIGAFATLLAWLLLEMIAMLVLGAIRPAQAVGIAAHFFALAIASLLGGLFLGKFGVLAGARHAAIAGALVVSLPWSTFAFAAKEASEIPFLAILLAILGAWAAGFGYAGGRLGIRLR